MNALSFTRGTLHILDVLLDPSGTTESDSVDGIGNHHVKTTNGLHDNDDDAHRKHFDCMFLCALGRTANTKQNSAKLCPKFDSQLIVS